MKNDAKKVSQILCDPHAKNSDKQLARVEADVLAFAYTFGKSINPEAVEDMRNALQQFIHSVEHEGVVEGRVVDALRNAKSALEKSKL